MFEALIEQILQLFVSGSSPELDEDEKEHMSVKNGQFLR